ncbi:MAG: hypothetical protein NVS3B3_24200 [Aquirhabdus sp.]
MDTSSQNLDIVDIVTQVKNNVDRTFDGTGGSYTYIIGNNGLGKSRILRELADVYETSNDGQVSSVLCVTNTLYDRFDIGRNKQKIKYLGARNASNAVFHTAIDRALARYILMGIVDTQRFMQRFSQAVEVEISLRMPGVLRPDRKNLAAHVDLRKVKDISVEKRLGSANLKVVKDMLNDTVKFKGLTKEKSAALLAFIDLNPDVAVLVKKKGHRTEYPFSELSSGEKNRILTAAKVLSHARNRCLILVDEPETSLHLHWQRIFHTSLVQMLSGVPHFHVVIATHSPIIVSECAHMNDVEIVTISDVDDRSSDGIHPDLKFDSSKAALIHSYDEVMLDMFKTAPKNTKSVHERITDILMDSVDGKLDTAEGKFQLKELLSTEGITAAGKQLVRRAIRVISDSQFRGLGNEIPG